MTPFVSIALFKRAGGIVFKSPRKEAGSTATAARKSAAWYWRGNVTAGDTIQKIIVMREFGGTMEIAERAHNAAADKPWVEYQAPIATALNEPHLKACMAEIGITEEMAAAAIPDVLTINGFTYRREI